MCVIYMMSASPSRKIVVLSGGTAANSLVDVFNDLIQKNNCTLSYIIPISDNGGSSSELIRVFGGPGIGDIRSMFCAIFPFSRGKLPVDVLGLASPIFQPHWDVTDVVNSKSIICTL